MKAEEIETEKSFQLEIIELESKLKNLEKAIIDSNKLNIELEKSKSEAQQMTQSLLKLERLNEWNLEMKQKELKILEEKDKEMVEDLKQHVVKIKEIEDLQKNHVETIKQFKSQLKEMETKGQNDGNSINHLQAKIKFFEEKVVEAAENEERNRKKLDDTHN